MPEQIEVYFIGGPADLSKMALSSFQPTIRYVLLLKFITDPDEDRGLNASFPTVEYHLRGTGHRNEFGRPIFIAFLE